MGKGLQEPPFSHTTPSTHRGHTPAWLRITQHHPLVLQGMPKLPQGMPKVLQAAGVAHPPLPALGTGRAASSQPDKVHFAFPNRAGESCNKDKA